MQNQQKERKIRVEINRDSIKPKVGSLKTELIQTKWINLGLTFPSQLNFCSHHSRLHLSHPRTTAVHNLLELLPAFEHLSTAFFIGLSCHSLGFRSLMPNPFVSPLLASLLSLFPNTGNQELCLGSLSTDSSYVATFHGFVFVHCL